jgi:hypothetical protein
MIDTSPLDPRAVAAIEAAEARAWADVTRPRASGRARYRGDRRRMGRLPAGRVPLDTGPWLQRLIGRPGWHEYVVREDGEVAGARGMFVGPNGTAWLGMDAPVPGVMTDDYALDAAMCAYIVADGLARGATSFVADIELPSAELDTPAYGYFARLGFRRPYVRTHWTRV